MTCPCWRRSGRCRSPSQAATAIRDGWVPIWVVFADRLVYVRTLYRRDTGWFARALRLRRARIGVPGLEADVTVEDVGNASAEVTAAVDAAYRTKYGGGAVSMVPSTAAAPNTLHLNRE